MACRYRSAFARSASFLLRFLSSASLLFRFPCSVPFRFLPFRALRFRSLRFRSGFPAVSGLAPFRCTLTTAQVRFNLQTFTIDLFRFFQMISHLGLFFKRLNQALDRLVSTTCMCYHTSSVDLSPGSPPGVLLLADGSLILEVGFTLRCLQRLSRPYFASLLCRWHDNSCTSGMSIPVLSY